MAEFYADSKFMRWLAGLKPRKELIMPLALKDGILAPPGSKKWNTRMLELERIFIKTVDDWAQDEIERVWPDRKGRHRQSQCVPRFATSAS